MHKREKLGDNFFSLFSSSSKYGQRLSILEKKELTKKFLVVESNPEKSILT